jgi:hypothetical protein
MKLAPFSKARVMSVPVVSARVVMTMSFLAQAEAEQSSITRIANSAILFMVLLLLRYVLDSR